MIRYSEEYFEGNIVRDEEGKWVKYDDVLDLKERHLAEVTILIKLVEKYKEMIVK